MKEIEQLLKDYREGNKEKGFDPNSPFVYNGPKTLEDLEKFGIPKSDIQQRGESILIMYAAAIQTGVINITNSQGYGWKQPPFWCNVWSCDSPSISQAGSDQIRNHPAVQACHLSNLYHMIHDIEKIANCIAIEQLLKDYREGNKEKGFDPNSPYLINGPKFPEDLAQFRLSKDYIRNFGKATIIIYAVAMQTGVTNTINSENREWSSFWPCPKNDTTGIDQIYSHPVVRDCPYDLRDSIIYNVIQIAKCITNPTPASYYPSYSTSIFIATVGDHEQRHHPALTDNWQGLVNQF